jgi:hypothetical protein
MNEIVATIPPTVIPAKAAIHFATMFCERVRSCSGNNKKARPNNLAEPFDAHRDLGNGLLGEAAGQQFLQFHNSGVDPVLGLVSGAGPALLAKLAFVNVRVFGSNGLFNCTLLCDCDGGTFDPVADVLVV